MSSVITSKGDSTETYVLPSRSTITLGHVLCPAGLDRHNGTREEHSKCVQQPNVNGSTSKNAVVGKRTVTESEAA